jgi:hypothetical protein
MSLAETDVAESTETPFIGPVPHTYWVESTGTPQLPLDAVVEVVGPDIPGGKASLKVNGLNRGDIEPLPNGDFEVVYPSGGTIIRLQFRQTGVDEEYLFGVAIPEKAELGGMEDPPITGVWGAEARPPQEPYPG